MEETAAPQAEDTFRPDPNFLDNLYESMTAPLSTGKAPDEGLMRRFMDFRVDAGACAPGVKSDFIITIATLMSGQELSAARAANGDAVAMGMAMAKESIYAVNGKRVSRGMGHLDVLWEALGPGGRNLIMSKWSELSVAGDIALGKANATMRMY